MTIPQSVVSIFYDEKQDRLSFLLRVGEQKEIEGVMARRLLKSMLKQLPNWLAQQGRIKGIKQKESIVTQAEQYAINQFQHQAAQQRPLEQQVVQRNKSATKFFIESVKLSSISKLDNSQGVVVNFFSFDKKDQINLTFTVEQFHQFIAVILEKVQDWDLSAPWKTGVLAQSKKQVMH